MNIYFESFFKEVSSSFEAPALTFVAGKLHVCTPLEFRPGLDPVVEQTSFGVKVKVLGHVCLKFLQRTLLRLLGTLCVHMVVLEHGELLFV